MKAYIQQGDTTRVLAEDAQLAEGHLARMRGLIGRRQLQIGRDALLIPSSAGIAQIHTFFMRFPIDALYLDDENRVIALQEAFRPWRVGPLVRGCRFVLELPAGVIQKYSVKEGGILLFG